MTDFFISYNKADKIWAEWLAWQLESEGYTVILQAWDFRPGENFVMKMQQATSTSAHTLAMLSPEFLAALYTQPEWAAAFAQDPTGNNRILLPVRVKKCELSGLLKQIIYIDLLGLDETAAKAALLQGVNQESRVKPSAAPAFPGHSTSESPLFPGQLSTTSVEKTAAINPDKPVSSGNQNIHIGGNVTGSVLNQGNISGGINITTK